MGIELDTSSKLFSNTTAYAGDIDKEKHVIIDRAMLMNLLNKDEFGRLTFKSNVKNIENKLDKSRIVGYSVRLDRDEITGNTIYAIHKSSDIDIISDKQIAALTGYSLFAKLRLSSLDIGEVELVDCKSVESMFDGIIIKNKLVIGNKDFSLVQNTYNMFHNAVINDIVDLSNMNFSNITKAFNMFDDCEIKELKLPNNFNKLTDTRYMFDSAKFGSSLDLSNTYFGKVCIASDMFLDTEIKGKLILKNVDFSNVVKADSIFRGIKVQELDLIGSKFDELQSTEDMFSEAAIKTLNISNSGLSKEILNLMTDVKIESVIYDL